MHGTLARPDADRKPPDGMGVPCWWGTWTFGGYNAMSTLQALIEDHRPLADIDALLKDVKLRHLWLGGDRRLLKAQLEWILLTGARPGDPVPMNAAECRRQLTALRATHWGAN
jgi:hypothetical protein